MRLALAAPEWSKAPLRPIARKLRLAAPVEPLWSREPSSRLVGRRLAEAPAVCNVCGWSGEEFVGPYHCEMAGCPQCASIPRDRFLLWCAAQRGALTVGCRVLETSPRMGDDYRAMMRRLFAYRASDFDLSAHRADLQLDLQNIDLPDSSLDLVLCAHVLEHVPDTDRALGELHRVIARGGRLYLQVPLQQGVTAPPAQPEFHNDDTPVFWRFGWDLTERLRAAGFEVSVLVTDVVWRGLNGEGPPPQPVGDDFDVEDLVRTAVPADLVGVVDDHRAARLGLVPGHQHAVWECVRS